VRALRRVSDLPLPLCASTMKHLFLMSQAMLPVAFQPPKALQLHWLIPRTSRHELLLMANGPFTTDLRDPAVITCFPLHRPVGCRLRLSRHFSIALSTPGGFSISSTSFQLFTKSIPLVFSNSDSSVAHTPAPLLPRYSSPAPSFSGVAPPARHSAESTPSSALGWAVADSSGTPSYSAAVPSAAIAAVTASCGEAAGQKELRNEIANLQVVDHHCVSYCICSLFLITFFGRCCDQLLLFCSRGFSPGCLTIEDGVFSLS
jgi:hypothetical protein